MKQTWSPQRIWLLGFCMLVGVFFYRTFLFGLLPVPTDALVGLYHPWRDLYAQTNPRGVPYKNFLITDPVRQQIPWRKLAMDTWKHGHIPSWNPYNFAGVPLEANIQAAAFYPLNIIFWLFRFPIAWSLLVMLQPFLAGIFLYLYLRHLKRSVYASFLGALSWAFCGFSVAWMSWGTMMQAALWVPLGLLATDKIIQLHAKKRSIKLWVGILILVMCMTVWAGHIQIALYALAELFAYIMWQCRAHYKAVALTPKPVWQIFIVIFCIAFFLTSGFWLPFVQYISQTVRVSTVESWKTPGWFLPWQHLVQFVVPDFFGNPATLNYWGQWNYGEFIGYIGFIPLILSLGALFVGEAASFWSWMIVASFILMLPHPLTMLLAMTRIPLFTLLQPTRLMMVIDLSLSILVAYGADAFFSGSYRRFARVFMTIGASMSILWVVVLSASLWHSGAVLIQNLLVARRNLIMPTMLFVLSIALFAAAKHKKRHGWIAMVVVVTIIDLFRFGWKFIPFTPETYFFPTTGVLSYLQKQPRPFRIASVDDRILPPNAAGYFGIESIEGYDPLAPKRYQDFLVTSGRGKANLSEPSGFNRIYTTHNFDSPLFPLFNVRYVLSLEPISSPLLKLVFTEGETHIYEYIHALPRVYLAEQITVVDTKNSEQILAAVFAQSRGVRPAVVESPVSVLSVPLSGDESVTIDSYEDSRIALTSHTVNPRLVVVLNRYDVRTHVAVDGKRATLFRVDYLFSGFVVPSGSHHVVLNYSFQ